LPTLSSGEPTGEVTLIDVYRGLGDVPRGTIRELRVVQIYPKLSVVANRPPVGIAGEENARAVLGTVPVAEDGSARFTVPARKLLCFQALDERGRAYQVMRTATYLQPGERVSCIGCHESRLSTLLSPGRTATQPARELQPESFGTTPFGYARTVQPVLDQHCIRCHGGEKPAMGLDLTGTPHQGFSRSYWSLCGGVNFQGGGTNPDNAGKALVPRFGARNRVQITPPGGMYGARGSRLLTMLDKGHNKVQLSPEEFRLLATWIDLNAVFYGTTDETEQAAQLRGEDIAPPAVQ
jgi:mono/diheme cytochrome c family protein